jgi:uncharacterized membrane protein YfhO
VYDAEVLDSDAFARALLADSDFNLRTTVILNQLPSLALPEQPAVGSTQVTAFTPESFTIQISTPENAILTLAHPDYPGWQATLDDQTVQILRTYGGLSAVEIPKGDHTLQFRYDSLSYRVGAILSLLTWLTLVLFIVVLTIRNLPKR